MIYMDIESMEFGVFFLIICVAIFGFIIAVSPLFIWYYTHKIDEKLDSIIKILSNNNDDIK